MTKTQLIAEYKNKIENCDVLIQETNHRSLSIKELHTLGTELTELTTKKECYIQIILDLKHELE